MRWLIFLGTLLFLWPVAAQERWYGVVMAITSPEANTRIFIRRPPENVQGNRFLAEISFRRQPQGQILFRKELRFDLAPGEMITFTYDLPPGEYRPWVDIMAPDGSDRREVRLPDRYEVPGPNPEWPQTRFSDVFLSFDLNPQQAFQYPLVDMRLDRSESRLFARMEVVLPRPIALDYRVVLYQENPETSRGAATAYVSLQADRGRLFPDEDRHYRLESPVMLRSLPEGQYLIEVLIFYGEELLVKKEARFSMGGILRDRIYAELPKSAEMSRYVLPPEEVNRILDLEEEVVRREAFKQAWENLYGGEGEKQMEAYFRKVYLANERFSQDDLPGWQTDQGRTFILYGSPKEIEQIRFKGQPAERWIYGQWALSFLFVSRNQIYQLVE